MLPFSVNKIGEMIRNWIPVIISSTDIQRSDIMPLSHFREVDMFCLDGGLPYELNAQDVMVNIQH